jgi:hypothetical protein
MLEFNDKDNETPISDVLFREILSPLSLKSLVLLGSAFRRVTQNSYTCFVVLADRIQILTSNIIYC